MANVISDFIHVEVAYADQEQQFLVCVRSRVNCTVREVILQSDVLKHFPSINLNHCQVGIFSSKVALTDVPKEGDRIEIYRPITIDPKQARRRRVGSTIP